MSKHASAAFVAGLMLGAGSALAGVAIAERFEQAQRANCAREGGRLVTDTYGVLGGSKGETWCLSGGQSPGDASMGLVTQ